jgi:uncharacterized protein DUF3943
MSGEYRKCIGPARRQETPVPAATTFEKHSFLHDESVSNPLESGAVRLLLAAVWVNLMAAPLAAQATVASPTKPTPTSPQTRHDSLSTCVGCPGSKHPARAVTSAVVFELIPYSVNRWVVKTPWSTTTLHSWSNNLRGGWGWDTDHFAVNQFAHPYSGNLSFNSARANGYSFWSSAPFALVGSVAWEYFGETTRPSINDLVNTTLGGITLGETTYRLSSLILDAQATGTTRIIREVGAALVDPPRAFGRLLDGDVTRVGTNPSGRTPSVVSSQVEIGYQRLSHGRAKSPLRGADQPFAYYALTYGDPMGRDIHGPFSSLRLDGTFGGASTGILSQLRAVGFLGEHDLGGDGVRHHRLALAMHYHYYDNAAFVSGGQGFSGVLLSRYPVGTRNTLRSEFWLMGVVLGAVKSDYSASAAAIANESARNYDYGPGAGGRAVLTFQHDARATVEASYQATWLDVVSGSAERQSYRTFEGRAQTAVTGRISVGLNEVLYNRTGVYATHPTVRAHDAQTQAFLAFRL